MTMVHDETKDQWCRLDETYFCKREISEKCKRHGDNEDPVTGEAFPGLFRREIHELRAANVMPQM